MESGGHPDVETSREMAQRFLTALFDSDDVVLFRPIESWIEQGKKRSKVDYTNCGYRRADPVIIRTAIRLLLQSSEANLTNIFFGVCPRFGRQEEYDLAWQIRTVRCLWMDIDHVSVDEALHRVAHAGLPEPSIVVNSGSGVHLYWILTEPFLIDDVGPPPPVKKEWTQLPCGRKKPKKYIVEDGEKVYLDKRCHLSRLSPKAQHLQDVLAGIAQLCGADHTTDLSRLLRIPGTLNRKDQRNGRAPLSTSLVKCDPSLKYSLSVFEPFAKPAPATERRKKIESMPLPKERKSISNKNADKLSDLIAASGIAPAGSRSETDFKLCCFAIRNGIGKEYLWSLVEQTGKFAEGCRRYFDHTWGNAEYEVQAKKLNDLETNILGITGVRAEDALGDPDLDGTAPSSNESDKPVIHVDASTTQVGDTLRSISNVLLRTKTCFIRTDQLVEVFADNINAILSSPELAGLLSQHVEFFFPSEEGGEYKPLPPAYGNTWLNNHAERNRLPAIKLFARNPVYSLDWRLVAPGFDGPTGIYYAGLEIKAIEGTAHWDALLRDFCFHSPADRTNYLGIVLTAILIPHFIGSKPAALFNGNQPGLGKSILAQVLSIVRDGHSAETISFNPNDEEFEKRLGAAVRRGGTTIIIDNAKSRGRDPKIESACLERSITDPILSFRLLGQSETIRTENSHIFCITANSADVSRDLVTRSVVINLHHEGDPQRRQFSIVDPEGYAQQHRSELLGELIGMVERWKQSGQPLAKTHSRFNKKGWGNVVGGILQACSEPDFLANADEAAASLDETRREFTELVITLAAHPQGSWKSAELVGLCAKEQLLVEQLGEGAARSKSTRFGRIAGRYVGERFGLPDGATAVLHKQEDRMGAIYRVGIETQSAER